MDPSLVSSQMSSDTSSEQLSIHEGAGYDKAFGLGDESKGFLRSSKREMSAQSPDSDVKSYAEESEEVVDKVEEGEGESGSDKEEDDGDEESCEGTSRGPRDNCPFILPED